jgi:hypothetical protein
MHVFTIDEATAAAIRRAAEDGGELAGMVELRRYFPLISSKTRISVRRSRLALPSFAASSQSVECFLPRSDPWQMPGSGGRLPIRVPTDYRRFHAGRAEPATPR